MAYNDPYATYRFEVTFENPRGFHSAPTRAGFQNVSGLSVNVNTMDYREGNEPTTIVRKLPGLTKVGNVTLKWGIIYEEQDNNVMFDWLGGVASLGEDGPKNGLTLMDIRIRLMNSTGTTEGTPEWLLYRCYPISFSVPDLNAQSGSVAISSMELAVGAFKFTAPSANSSEIQTSGN